VRLPERNGFIVLTPFDLPEGITLGKASGTAGRTPGTIRNWCIEHGIGRKIGGSWVVSKVALTMFLDGDDVALAAYLSGDRESDFVVAYFLRFGLKPQKCTALQSY
jgi:hypothetical protein